MTDLLIEKLPAELVDHIKLFTGEAYWCNKGKFRLVYRIPRNDERYFMLSKRPRVKQVFNDYNDHRLRGCTWFKREDGRFVVINVRFSHLRIENNFGIEGHFWEMYNGDEKTAVYIG